MIRPRYFGANPETSGSNEFQLTDAQGKEDEISQKAIKEFDSMVDLLRANEIAVELFDQPIDNQSPDIVFPNNWFTVHPESYYFIYPMESRLRRTERIDSVLSFLEREYENKELIDLSWFESEHQYLEGTGSMVFDKLGKTVYCGLSSRSSAELAKRVSEILGYELELIDTKGPGGLPIYHTNVFLSISNGLAILCSECIPSKKTKARIKSRLKDSGRKVIDISLDQTAALCGNVLELKSEKSKKFLVLSSTSQGAFSEDQLDSLSEKHSLIVPEIPTIEKFGGGGVRCMLAELY